MCVCIYIYIYAKKKKKKKKSGDKSHLSGLFSTKRKMARACDDYCYHNLAPYGIEISGGIFFLYI